MPTVNLHDYPDSVYTRTICECSSNDCDLDISFNVDPHGHLELGFETKLKVWPNSRYDDWFWVGWWWRIKSALKILFLGRIEADHYIMLNDKAVKEFRESLEQSIEKVEAYWANKKKEK